MKKPSAEFTFGTWTAPAAGVTVEFPLEIMDELRLAACDGLRQLARGGLEIGGVLFGSRRESILRVVNWRAIECEHSRGPALLLSPRDRETLSKLLETAKDEVDLRGLQPVGWFVSHTRSEVSLLASDQEIYREFFPESWQVTLVLHPGRHGACRAGFFIREGGATPRTGSSYQEFTIEPLSEPTSPAESTVTALAARGPSLVRLAARANPALAAPADTYWDTPKFSAAAPGSGSRWIWAIPGLLALMLAGAMLRDRWRPVAQRPISLRLQEQGNQLTLLWDGNAPTIQGAFGGSIEIQDGAVLQHLELSREQLKGGRLSYTRNSADVEATLILRLTGGATAREAARYVGPVGPPQQVTEAEAAALRRERDRLVLENARLKEQARVLQNRLKAQQNRQKIEAAKPPPEPQ